MVCHVNKTNLWTGFFFILGWHSSTRLWESINWASISQGCKSYRVGCHSSVWIKATRFGEAPKESSFGLASFFSQPIRYLKKACRKVVDLLPLCWKPHVAILVYKLLIDLSSVNVSHLYKPFKLLVVPDHYSKFFSQYLTVSKQAATPCCRLLKWRILQGYIILSYYSLIWLNVP